jgi:hypothetical protein
MDVLKSFPKERPQREARIPLEPSYSIPLKNPFHKSRQKLKVKLLGKKEWWVTMAGK